MTNPFLKAAMLTVAVVLLAVLLVSQLDSAREKTLSSSIDSVILESENARLIGRYSQVMGDAEPCSNVNLSTQLQKDRTYALAFRIQDYEKANIVGEEYDSLRRAYFVSLMDLYLTNYENGVKCPSARELPLVFYYTEGDCPDCKAQNDVLERLAGRCSPLRIYAFPVNSEFQFIDLLKARDNIGATPAIVVNGTEKLAGLQGEDKLLSTLKRNGAVCN